MSNAMGDQIDALYARVKPLVDESDRAQAECLRLRILLGRYHAYVVHDYPRGLERGCWGRHSPGDNPLDYHNGQFTDSEYAEIERYASPKFQPQDP